MATRVEELIDILFEMVDEAKNVPMMTRQCMLDRDRILDLIEDIRTQLPGEIAEARELVSKRKEYLASANREAEAKIRSAEKEARRLMEEDTVLLQSRKEAAELVHTAREESLSLRRSANDYCEDALRRTEEAVTEACEEIRKSRARFSAAASGADISNIRQ
ncbi:MAG: hypothetical protein R3Y63_06755 [Eubacteriales bacterium]